MVDSADVSCLILFVFLCVSSRWISSCRRRAWKAAALAEGEQVCLLGCCRAGCTPPHMMPLSSGCYVKLLLPFKRRLTKWPENAEGRSRSGTQRTSAPCGVRLPLRQRCWRVLSRRFHVLDFYAGQEAADDSFLESGAEETGLLAGTAVARTAVLASMSDGFQSKFVLL